MAEAKAPLTQRERSELARSRVQDAAKWMVGSFAAVGAALIAGSQLSSIGKLSVCSDYSLRCTRLWWALGGAVVALAGVVWAIWVGVEVMISQTLSAGELQAEWSNRRSSIRRYFTKNHLQQQGFDSFDAIEEELAPLMSDFDAKSRAFEEASAARKRKIQRELEDIRDEVNNVQDRAEAFVAIANEIRFGEWFRRTALLKMLVAGALSAIGIGLFAWAANPPDEAVGASLRGAHLQGVDLAGVNLRNTDLRDANLREANLSGVDLSGANLDNARLEGVTWSKTICPDGAVSDNVGGSCINHLTP